MHSDRLLDDKAIRDQFADGLTGVGIADLAALIGVELLSAEIRPVASNVSV